MPIYRLGDDTPDVSPTAFVSTEATLIGKVKVGHRASIWFGAVLRGDNEPITIGDDTSVQECAVLHTDPGAPLEIGSNVIIGHQAMVHGCRIGAGSLIGIQAILLSGTVIGRQCLVGAGAVVTERKTFPDRSLILGAPAKLVRELTDDEVALIEKGAAGYARRGERFRSTLVRVG